MKLWVMMRRQVNKRTLVIGTRATFAVATLAAWFGYSSDAATPPPAAALPQVVVSKSLARDSWLGFICQFSAIEQVELRAQVGGTLIGIYFKDGDIVHKGDFLFTVDARPYEIRLAQANAQDRYRPGSRRCCQELGAPGPQRHGRLPDRARTCCQALVFTS